MTSARESFIVGETEIQAGRLHKAETALRAALELSEARIALAEVLSTLAGGFRFVGRFAEGEAKLREAVGLCPDDARLWSNLGLFYQAAGAMDAAMSAYDRALSLDPDEPDIRFNRATARLTKARDPEGWREFDARLACADSVLERLPFKAPLWDGSDPVGRTILVYPEQGLGDALHFARYASALAQRGASVVLAAKPGLVPLLSSLENVTVTDFEHRPAFDAHIPLMSLPRWLGEPPWSGPYLKAEPSRRRNLGEGFKVGLCWQGSRANFSDPLRSLSLKALAPLAESGARFFSLQVGEGAENLSTFPGLIPLSDLDADALFLDTAAVMMDLDLVLTVDTAIAHLAGALGRPTWLMLNSAPDWRWGLERAETSWYPSLRLWRQTSFGDWAGVVTAVGAALQREMSR